MGTFEKTTTAAAELKTDWLKVQNYKGIVRDSAVARYITKYGFDISEKSESEINAMCDTEKPAKKEKTTNEPAVTVDIKTLNVGDMYRYKTSSTLYEVKEVINNENGELSEMKVEADNGKKWNLKSARDMNAQVIKA